MSRNPWVSLDIGAVSRTELPERLAFCDATGDALFRADTDIELSHWYPNRTPSEYRADTSTEMVLRFIQNNADHDYVGVGDHCDTDAALSLFALVEPELAAAHEATLGAVARSGDFGLWMDGRATALYGDLRRAWGQPDLVGPDRFARSFDTITAFLDESSPGDVAAASVQGRCDELVETLERVEVSDHLTAYVVDSDSGDYRDALAAEPRFDQPIGTTVWPSHRARNRLDAERLQLLCMRTGDGWVHTLWYPQYLPWDTEHLWRPPDIQFTGDRLEWRWPLPELDDALSSLTERDGPWWRADVLAPFVLGFPLLATSPKAGLEFVAVASGPDRVMSGLAKVFR